MNILSSAMGHLANFLSGGARGDILVINPVTEKMSKNQSVEARELIEAARAVQRCYWRDQEIPTYQAEGHTERHLRNVFDAITTYRNISLDGKPVRIEFLGQIDDRKTVNFRLLED